MKDFFHTIFDEYQIGFCLLEISDGLYSVRRYNETFQNLIVSNIPTSEKMDLFELSKLFFNQDHSSDIADAIKNNSTFRVDINSDINNPKSETDISPILLHDSRLFHENFRSLEIRVIALPKSDIGFCVQDVTARIQEEKHRIASQKLEGMGLLAQGIAHDFNNLLSGILGVTSLAGMKISESEPMAQTLDDIIRISENAKRLTGKLLSYGRGEVVHEMPFDIEPLVRDMLKIVKMGLPQGEQIECRVDKGNHFMKGDPGEISQVILNVFKNAVEAIDMYKGKILIELYTDRTGHDDEVGKIQLRVEDNGIGMDLNILDQIFKPFFSTKRLGRGLGMTVVSRLVAKHGGSLDIESAIGAGTIVSITFPAAVAEQPKNVPTALSFLGGRETIIIIDSDSVFTNATTEYLQQYGYIVHCFTGGMSAIKHVDREEAGTINMIICELPPSDISASELAYYLIETVPLAKILFTSGSDDVSVVADILNEGLANFIQKPYTPRELIAKMRGMLDEIETA